MSIRFSYTRTRTRTVDRPPSPRTVEFRYVSPSRSSSRSRSGYACDHLVRPSYPRNRDTGYYYDRLAPPGPSRPRSSSQGQGIQHFPSYSIPRSSFEAGQYPTPVGNYRQGQDRDYAPPRDYGHRDRDDYQDNRPGSSYYDPTPRRDQDLPRLEYPGSSERTHNLSHSHSHSRSRSRHSMSRRPGEDGMSRLERAEMLTRLDRENEKDVKKREKKNVRFETREKFAKNVSRNW